MKKELIDMVMKTGIGSQAKEKFNNENGHWVTIEGNHVFIES